jgi:hypothetical protein
MPKLQPKRWCAELSVRCRHKALALNSIADRRCFSLKNLEMKSAGLFHYRICLAVTFGLATPGSAIAATLIDSFSPETNDRFANNPAFVGAALDFSGVGRDALGHWAVMLTPTVFLSAYHYSPTGSLIFREGNDPAAAPVTASIASGQQIGNTDLYIGRLQSALPATIASYQFATVSLTNLPQLGVFMGGISPTASGYGSGTPDVTDQTVGTNWIEAYQRNLTVAGSVGDALFTIKNLSGDSAYGYSYTPYEAQLAVGDSGSPLLAVSNGNLIVAGIAWAVGSLQIASGVFRDASVFTYTGSYSAQIENYISASNVPEPSAWLLVSLAGITLGWRRHRS